MTTNKTEQIQELDVRVLIPIERHKTLLQMFKDLPVGKSFIFINDHDPLPLYYEMRSVHGDVVGWDYLQRGGVEWKVKVTRNETSQGREFTDISTLMDLRKVDKKDWMRVIFHRYGMTPAGETMEIIAEQEPTEIHDFFNKKFAERHVWTVKKNEPGEYVVHITKKTESDEDKEEVVVVKEFDVRPYPPAERHEMVFNSYDELRPGEAFIFYNDHDPKPLYYQIEAESPVPFTWEYLISGPEEWKVKVAKTRA